MDSRQVGASNATLTPGQSFVCDVIRYVAALLVAAHHLPSLLKPDAYLTADRSLANLGEIGVTAFFILSGLLISHTITRKAQSNSYTFREYFIERSVRIYLVFLPAMLLIVAAGVASAATGYGADTSEWRKFDLWHFSTNLLMLSGVRQIAPHLVTFSFMEQSWTLNYEFFFYALFGLILLPIRGRAGLALRAVLFAAILLVTLQLPRTAVLVLALTWGLGVLISRLLIAGRSGSGVALIVATIALLVVAPLRAGHFTERITLVLFIAAGTFFLLTNTTRFVPPSWLRASAQTFAGFSYSLYLLHILLYWALFSANPAPVEWVQARFGSAATAVGLLAVINCGAWLFSLLTERHTNTVRQAMLSLGTHTWMRESP